MAAIGVRSSWEASATKRRSRASDSRSRSSLATRARKADSMRLSMTLRVRASRPTSVLSFSPGHAFGEVAVGDRLGRRLHVAERAEPDAHQPEPAEQGDEHGAAGHEQLDQEEVVEGAARCRPGAGRRSGSRRWRGSRPGPGRSGRPAWADGAVEVGDLRPVGRRSGKPVIVVGIAGV